MGAWKTLESPTLKVPLELRETTTPAVPDRIWEVQELRTGCVFKVTFTRSMLEGEPGSGVPANRGIREAEIERAVCLAVEEALLSEPEKEPGVTYEISVGAQEVETAVGLSS
jgi:hypothetical protein